VLPGFASALRVGTEMCTVFGGEVLINPDKTIETISARQRIVNLLARVLT
jgi:hypothetical protein